MNTEKPSQIAIDLYLPTLVTVKQGQEWITASEFASMQGTTVHVITAWNPPDATPSQFENQQANERLKHVIADLGLSTMDARGSDPKSDYYEDSLAVVGLTENQALELGATFKQEAIFRITESLQTVVGTHGEPWEVSRGSGLRLELYKAARWIQEPRNLAHIQVLVDRYFGCGESTEVFQGRNFEWFVSQSDKREFTPFDFLAVSSLSVDIPPEWQRLLIVDSDAQFADQLSLCWEYADENREAASFEWVWVQESPFNDLYGLLRELHGVGRVSCSKLMAAKFPAIIPIRDARVEMFLGLERSVEWWKPLLNLYEATKETLADISTGSVDVEPLRKLDVILWMEAGLRGIGK